MGQLAMSSCCGNAQKTRTQGNRHACPVNGKEYVEVRVSTIIHHIVEPWNWDDDGEAFYFCDDPECRVVYFSASNKVITQDQLRTPIGQKNSSEMATLCYCFGVSRGDYIKDQRVKAYVLDQTTKQTCACDARNPSGRCCLKDFPS
jgi:sugar lactone lactonase YvrE